jgi:hypothetical protein
MLLAEWLLGSERAMVVEGLVALEVLVMLKVVPVVEVLVVLEVLLVTQVLLVGERLVGDLGTSAHGTEGVALELVDLGRVGATLPLQVQVLTDCIVK